MELEQAVMGQTDNIVRSQLDAFCRLCLLKRTVLVPLTSEFNGVMIPEMLWKVSGTLINVLEPLPRVLCERCLTKLDLAYSIAQEFRKQEERLRSFCWKGVLLEELEQFQQSDEASKEKYTEEVIRRLVSALPEQKSVVIEEAPKQEEEENKLSQLDDIIETDSFLSDHFDMIVEEIHDEVDLAHDDVSNALSALEEEVLVKHEVQPVLDERSDADPCYELLPLTVDKLEPEEWIESDNETGSNGERFSDKKLNEIINFTSEGSADSQDLIEYEEVDPAEKQNARNTNRQTVPDANGQFVCTECPKTFTVRKTFLNHVKRHEHVNQESFKCPKCQKIFGTKERLMRHKSIHEQNLCCDLCGHVCRDGHDMRAHRILHQKGLYRCGLCRFSSDSPAELKVHVDTGSCLDDSCSKKAPGRPPLRPPILKNSVCPFEGCNYTAETYGAMYVHKRAKHLQQFKCVSCGKRFAFANQLRVHEKLHTGEKPFKCDICSKRFRRMFSYKEHIAIHRGAEAYNCDMCGKVFTRPRYLAAHMLTHSEDRSFECTLCGNRYKTNGELNKHVRSKHESLEYGNGNDLIVEDYDYFEDEFCM
ncbi:zinc finger protein 37-like [Topomyia yanbarensis]|uniref:zinc finger protein 37-like n=1 Tax=Topomyia yanbarensis TaxID=2498891 RepID=UPI00273CED18|nr:zinc finger protein 37-like [Topomyia yanbarensis]